MMVSKNMVVEIGRVMPRDEENGMMEPMHIGKEKKLLQQQPQKQQPLQPGAAASDPWPPPSLADLNARKTEREIGRHAFLGFVWEAEQQQGRLR